MTKLLASIGNAAFIAMCIAFLGTSAAHAGLGVVGCEQICPTGGRSGWY